MHTSEGIYEIKSPMKEYYAVTKKRDLKGMFEGKWSWYTVKWKTQEMKNWRKYTWTTYGKMYSDFNFLYTFYILKFSMKKFCKFQFFW